MTRLPFRHVGRMRALLDEAARDGKPVRVTLPSGVSFVGVPTVRWPVRSVVALQHPTAGTVVHEIRVAAVAAVTRIDRARGYASDGRADLGSVDRLGATIAADARLVRPPEGDVA